MKLFSVRLPEELIIKLKVFAAAQETTVQVLAGEFITKGLAAAKAAPRAGHPVKGS